jgi:hypothetical protein
MDGALASPLLEVQSQQCSSGSKWSVQHAHQDKQILTLQVSSGGTHTVCINDAAGCSSELEVVMPDAVTINPIATVTYDCVNNAAANRVEVSCDASNDPADLDFDLDGLETGKQATSLNVAPGSHC